jgi:plasmid maintenance system antidote protein VapI
MTKRISKFKVEIVRRGLAQVDVAAAADLSPIRLNRILNGRVQATVAETLKLKKVLGAVTTRLEGA